MAAADPAPSSTPPTSDPPPPERVRVVLADAARARRGGQVRAELAEQSGVGEALVTGLMRAQLGLALRLAVVVAIGLGGLPLLFAVAPAVAGARLFGVPLPWLLLGLVAYPFLFVVGAAYVWLSERTEREFADLVDRT
ncbi:hypothetical protein GCM10009557_58610 [Virgisporangium ochraceum]|uniref:DUF485 domain-containing protein n=1 Tax=Virgisporangium ochraceum TaxID=65505 RepID=A0A8J3ZL61_9ACTN|nr:hypothetical protein [Virgisporangium ochraceum]GIJ66092.1 hypothetical protein Voc01_010090 [Virgisporangium ochraceum]